VVSLLIRLSCSFETEGSKRKGHGGRSGPSGGISGVSPGDCAEGLDDDEDMTTSKSKTHCDRSRARSRWCKIRCHCSYCRYRRLRSYCCCCYCCPESSLAHTELSLILRSSPGPPGLGTSSRKYDRGEDPKSGKLSRHKLPSISTR
jgi:hypothetical protein